MNEEEEMIDWFGCYSSRWQGEIVPEAFSHPAKFARGLIWRIYAHALERGYLKPGDWVADPFAGTGLGAADALTLGLNWFGNELEQNFVDMGSGYNCTGISKDDWVACFGRWDRFRYKDGRHWCPRCLAEAGLVLEDWEPALPGMEAPTVSYKRSSGKIPHTEPHRYMGNLDLFARHARGGATAVLVQGDSRRLVEVLEGARAEGLISSPPYATQTVHGRCDVDPDKLTGNPPGPHSQIFTMDAYGTDPAQLGNMPTGEPPQAVIGSPPHSVAGLGHDAGHPRLDAAEDARREAEGCGRRPAYGKSDGQLAAMREGDVDAVIASPPFSNSQQSRDGDFKLESTKVNPTPRKLADRSYFPAEMESDGQLAALPEGEPPKIDGCISSPPYEGIGQDGRGIAKEGVGGIRPYTNEPVHYHSTRRDQRNLGNQRGDTFWAASRAILLQCHEILAPGGVAIWVLKDFIRAKKRVDFTGQWRSLCESCGFEMIEVIRAWLVEDRGAQFALNGDLVERKVARKSFFRRLYEAKARAAEFWKSVGRDDKARHLWQAHHDLWENRRSGLPDKKPPYPTRSRILVEAQMMAYVEAGKPDVEIDTQIDWEIVLITRKAA